MQSRIRPFSASSAKSSFLPGRRATMQECKAVIR